MLSLCVVSSLWLVQPSGEKCPDCDVAGKIKCAQCDGTAKVSAACPECAGAAAKDCGRCRGRGYLECSDCGGAGYRIGYQVGIGGKPVRIPCRRFLPCYACKGERGISCKKCTGTGVVPSTCPTCTGAGKTDCPRCEGTGYLTPLVVAAPPRPVGEAVRAAEQRDRLARAVGAITEASSKVGGLRARLDDLSSRYEAASGSARALPQGPSVPTALRPTLRDCRYKWADCTETHEDCRESLRKLAAIRDGAQEVEEVLRRSIAKLEERGLATALSMGPSTPEEEFAGQFTDAVQLVDTRLGRLAVHLTSFEKALGQLGEEQAACDAKAAKERQDAEAKEKESVRLQAVVTKIAQASGITGATVQSLDSASLLALGLEIVCFDRESRIPEGESDATPSEGLLQKLPALATAVFDRCPEVSRLRLRIDAEGFTDTGLPAHRTIQTFSLEQPRWRELMTGKYRDEWMTVLSKSKPFPPYPRVSTPGLDPPWIIVAISAISIGGLVVIYIARMRMLQRF